MTGDDLLRAAGLLPPLPPTPAQQARNTFERRKRRGEQLVTFLRDGPHKPLATPDEILEIACTYCSAQPGQPCDTTHQRPSLLWTVFREYGNIHLRRYQDRTHDPR